MTIHLRSGNMAETCHVDEKVDYHVSAKLKRNGYKQIHVSVGFTKYGNMQFRPVVWYCFVSYCKYVLYYISILYLDRRTLAATHAIYPRRLYTPSPREPQNADALAG